LSHKPFGKLAQEKPQCPLRIADVNIRVTRPIGKVELKLPKLSLRTSRIILNVVHDFERASSERPRLCVRPVEVELPKNRIALLVKGKMLAGRG
jgi:hypothetical protein